MRRVLLLSGLLCVGLLLCLNSQAEPGRKKTPVTTPDQSDPKLITVIYAVADLVVPIAYNLDAPKAYEVGPDKAENATVAVNVAGAANDPAVAQQLKALAERTPCVTQEDALIRLICAVVAPESWQKNGIIEYRSQGMGLVVRQTQQVQEEIAAFLAGLRRLQDVQVATEVRMVSVPEAAAEKILGDLNATAKGKVTFLDDAQSQNLLKALQNDKRTEVLQAPNMTVFNGQRGSISVSNWRFFLTGGTIISDKGQTMGLPTNLPVEIGFRSAVCPTVSPDRQNVVMDLRVKRTTVTEPVPLIPIQIPVSEITADGKKKNDRETRIFQTFFQQPQIATQVVEQKFSIPAGKTALIVAGKEKRETATEISPDMVTQILVWAGALRKEVAYGQEAFTNILLVTPRIIVNDEYKENFSNNKTRSTLRPLGN